VLPPPLAKAAAEKYQTPDTQEETCVARLHRHKYTSLLLQTSNRSHHVNTLKIKT
jgi:hypothetical protein